MIQIAICLEDTKNTDLLTQELELCFQKREITAHIRSYHSISELTQGTSFFRPDLLIFSFGNQIAQMQKAVYHIKAKNKNMMSLIFHQDDSFSLTEYSDLQPVFELKSLKREEIWQQAYKLYQFQLSFHSTFTYYCRPAYHSTEVKDILYFVSDARRIHLCYADDTTDTFYNKLDDIEMILQYKHCQFVRIHKSYLVNADYIASIDRSGVILTNGTNLKFSNYQRYAAVMRSLYERNLSSKKALSRQFA